MVEILAPVNTVPYGLWMKENLTPLDWIKAGFRALCEGGPQAIRAERIAKELQVSKGSFYWHFKTVDDLKRQMLEAWKQRATERTISDLEDSQLPPKEKLFALIERATGSESQSYGGRIVEAAIRDWGRYDARAAGMVAEVDALRLSYLRDRLSECGLQQEACATNAAILYGALIGLETLSHDGLVDSGQALSSLLAQLLPVS